MRILLVTPPLTQLNTPYPATAYLAGYLNKQGFDTFQLDLGIELIDRLFTSAMLAKIFDLVDDGQTLTFTDSKMIAQRERYEKTIDAVVNFLRGNDLSLANRIAKRGYLPEGERFKNAVDLEYMFGDLGTVDLGKHLATLYIEDISDFIRRNVSSHFELIRYAESLCTSLPSFDKLQAEVEGAGNLVDSLIAGIFAEKISQIDPNLVGFSIPFPGNLYGAMICARWIKQNRPDVKVAMGGGYVNTELRQISDKRLFGYIDYLIYDDGELPLARLAAHLEGKVVLGDLVRTSYLQDGYIKGNDNLTLNIASNELAAPLFSQLPTRKYIDMVETTNPMLKLWSDGRWNKIMLAHGCYWAKCAFCDTSLDYISRFVPYDPVVIVDMMESAIAQTGQSGFHFVDEAAPPALLKKISLEIIKRGLNVSWWANIRFEKSFTKDLCRLLAHAGCIAVSGGLEVASDRILKLINKGVDVKQAAQVADSFTSAGVMVHAYLMYGFPTETDQETVDSLEVVRQLFEQQLIQSAFWHRFALTVHSPVKCNAANFGLKYVENRVNEFANNEVFFKDGSTADLPMLGEGLRKATYNYMLKLGFERPLGSWFEARVPRTTIPPTLIQGYMVTTKNEVLPEKGDVVWIGDGYQLILTDSRRPKFHVYVQNKVVEAILKADEIAFWESFMGLFSAHSRKVPLNQVVDLAEQHLSGGEITLVNSKVWKILRKNGLIIV